MAKWADVEKLFPQVPDGLTPKLFIRSQALVDVLKLSAWALPEKVIKNWPATVTSYIHDDGSFAVEYLASKGRLLFNIEHDSKEDSWAIIWKEGWFRKRISSDSGNLDFLTTDFKGLLKRFYEVAK